VLVKHLIFLFSDKWKIFNKSNTRWCYNVDLNILKCPQKAEREFIIHGWLGGYKDPCWVKWRIKGRLISHSLCVFFQSFFHSSQSSRSRTRKKFSLSYSGNTKGGSITCTFDLLFDWFGLVCFANKNKNCQLSYGRFQTSQTGGQWYSDTSPFSIPALFIPCGVLKIGKK
jgi:hypothetical protein